MSSNNKGSRSIWRNKRSRDRGRSRKIWL